MRMLNPKLLTLVAPLALTLACASANDDDGDGTTTGTTTGDGTTTGTMTGDGSTTGTMTGDGTTTGTMTGDGTTTGTMTGSTTGTTTGDFVNEFAADWARLADTSNPDDINQCLGFEDDGVTYRVYDTAKPNANPKDENPCPGNGNTDDLNGNCNVPAGFQWKDSFIGNKACTCDKALGFDCSTSLLDGLTLGAPGDCGGLAKDVDDGPCTVEFDTCMASDLPTACEYTTPKGCVCLENAAGENVWQCGSTNSWFDCGNGVDCPAAWPASITSGADIKTNCSDPTCNDSPSCE